MATQELVAADAMSAVHRYIDAFNEGNVKGMAAACAVPGSILDGMPPHVWHGPTAAEDWYRDVLINTKKEGASDFVVTLGTPRHMEITGDAAYLVVPATMRFKVHGKEITQSGAVFLPWRFGSLPTAGGSQRGLGRKELPSNRFERLHTKKR